MRKAVIPIALAFVLAPLLVSAQDMDQLRSARHDAQIIDTQQVLERMRDPLAVEDCFDCILGIWDDPGLTTPTGAISPFIAKEFYVGVKFAGPYDRLSGLEFSISGIREAEDGILVLSIDPVSPVPPPTIVLGTLPAPADTSATSSGSGGMNFAWSTCITGSQALLKVTILSFSTISEKVIWVKRKYPPTNPAWHTPVFTQCDAPDFTATRISGGCYGLNFTGTLPCDTEPNQRPVCDAGGPYAPTCTSPTTSVALDGSASFDPEGGPLSYLWSTDCPGAVIFDATNAMATLELATPPGSNTSCNVVLTVSDAVSASSCTTTVSVACPVSNKPPVCDAGGPYEGTCAGPTTAIQLDGTGSFDPDMDVLEFSWSSDCPGASFDDPGSATPTLVLDSRCCPISCSVTLVVSDGQESSTCNAPVQIVGGTGPPAARVLWPPDHQYVRIEPEDCVAADCQPQTPTSVQVVSVRSDEPEDAQGLGDGATFDDIVIECPDVVLLRAERAGAGDGRVYTITYELDGPTGPRNVECKVSVPHDESLAPAVEGPGPGYSVTSNCDVGRTRQQTTGLGGVAPDQGVMKAQLSRGGEPGIAVSFALDEAGSAILDVYDISGRHVASVRAELPAGSHVLRWSGRDMQGREVASGIYLMQLRAAGTVQRSKALWMR